MGGPVNNVVTVSASGTATRFATATTPLKAILIWADVTNNGNVYVGDSTVATSNSLPLEPDAYLRIVFVDTESDTSGELTDFYVDADVPGDSIRYVGTTV